MGDHCSRARTTTATVDWLPRPPIVCLQLHRQMVPRPLPLEAVGEKGELCRVAPPGHLLPRDHQKPSLGTSGPSVCPEARLSRELGSLTHDVLIHKCQPIHSPSRCLRALREDKFHFTHPVGQQEMLVGHSLQRESCPLTRGICRAPAGDPALWEGGTEDATKEIHSWPQEGSVCPGRGSQHLSVPSHSSDPEARGGGSSRTGLGQVV